MNLWGAKPRIVNLKDLESVLFAITKARMQNHFWIFSHTWNHTAHTSHIYRVTTIADMLTCTKEVLTIPYAVLLLLLLFVEYSKHLFESPNIVGSSFSPYPYDMHRGETTLTN